MPDKSRDPHIAALEAVYAALKELDDFGRKKVLASVFALLELGPSALHSGAQAQGRTDERHPTASSIRPVSLVELINEKHPGTNAQRIAVFAYYREKSEGLTRFARDDLKPYFAKAKQPAASNYDRDFVETVRRGWIHEDGADSYLTTKGVEAIESGFEGERRYTKGRKKAPTARKKAPRTKLGRRLKLKS